MKLTGWLKPEEFWHQYDRMEELVRESAGDIPCYAVSGWSGPLALGEWDLGGRPPSTAGLAHGSAAAGPTLATTTTTEDPTLAVAFHRMTAAGPPADGDDFSRRLAALVAEPGEEVSIPVDGVPVPFTVWREADHWWAAAQHGEYGLFVEAKDLEPEALSLCRVLDIEPYLLGRRAQLRSARGEG
jgi:hypothetical protein